MKKGPVSFLFWKRLFFTQMGIKGKFNRLIVLQEMSNVEMRPLFMIFLLLFEKYSCYLWITILN